jgi:hypothetical protein
MNRSLCSTVLVLFILLSGCSQPSDSGTSSTSVSSTSTPPSTLTTSSTNPPIKTPENSTVPATWEWTGCTGFALALDGPTTLFPGTTPPGWEPGSSPDNAMTVQAWRCDRVSWGLFERGPIFMVQEWSTNFTAPSKCEEARAGPHNILESIWFSDSEVADFARSVYGMPTYVADFTFTEAAVSPGLPPKEWIWTWTTSDGAESRVTIHDPNTGLTGGSTPNFRFYWHNGQGISYMDFHFTYENQFTSGYAEGVLAPPMMWGKAGIPNFVGAFENLELNASLSGTISRFGDAGCTKPL